MIRSNESRASAIRRVLEPARGLLRLRYSLWVLLLTTFAPPLSAEVPKGQDPVEVTPPAAAQPAASPTAPSENGTPPAAAPAQSPAAAPATATTAPAASPTASAAEAAEAAKLLASAKERLDELDEADKEKGKDAPADAHAKELRT